MLLTQLYVVIIPFQYYITLHLGDFTVYSGCLMVALLKSRDSKYSNAHYWIISWEFSELTNQLFPKNPLDGYFKLKSDTSLKSVP